MLEFGLVNNTRGLAGEIKVTPYCDYKEQYEAVPLIVIDGKEYGISEVKYHKGQAVLKLFGVDTVEAADKLKNKTVYVRRDDLPPLDGGRYYIVDLLGCTGVMPDGGEIGELDDVIQSGAADIYVFDGKPGTGKPVLIPKVLEYISGVDIENRKIILTEKAVELLNI
jgi:16S rRNA processing protein RimM